MYKWTPHTNKIYLDCNFIWSSLSYTVSLPKYGGHHYCICICFEGISQDSGNYVTEMALHHISGPMVVALHLQECCIYGPSASNFRSHSLSSLKKKTPSTVLPVSIQLPKPFEPNNPRLSRQVADSGPFSKFNLKLLEKISQKLPRNHTAAFQHDPFKDSRKLEEGGANEDCNSSAGQRLNQLE